MASADDSDGSVDIEIVEVATPGKKRRQQVRDDLATKRVELVEKELEGATGRIAELEAEVKRLREKARDTDEKGGEPAPEPLVPLAVTERVELELRDELLDATRTIAELVSEVKNMREMASDADEKGGQPAPRPQGPMPVTERVELELSDDLEDATGTIAKLQAGVNRLRDKADGMGGQPASLPLVPSKRPVYYEYQDEPSLMVWKSYWLSETTVCRLLGAFFALMLLVGGFVIFTTYIEKEALISRLATEKEVFTAQLAAEKAQLIARVESEKEKLRAKTADLERKDELRQRKLQWLDHELQSMREKYAGCESALEKLGRNCNLGVVHSTVKWVADQDWWAVSRCLKQCFLG